MALKNTLTALVISLSCSFNALAAPGDDIFTEETESIRTLGIRTTDFIAYNSGKLWLGWCIARVAVAGLILTNKLPAPLMRHFINKNYAKIIDGSLAVNAAPGFIDGAFFATWWYGNDIEDSRTLERSKP